MKERKVVPELLDGAGVDVGELRRAQGMMRVINRRLGGTAAVLGRFGEWSRGWERGQRVTVLDIGTGCGDVAVSLRRWGALRGFDVRVTGVDRHGGALELAREYVGASGVDGVELAECDALKLTERYEPGSFDYVHAGMVLHHLNGLGLLTALRIMDRLARAGIVWNDLVRSRVSAAVLEALLMGRSAIEKHDARASVRAGFTRREVMEAAARVDLGYATYRRHWWYRFTLAGERRGAWKR